jgi:hypothetical protein
MNSTIIQKLETLYAEFEKIAYVYHETLATAKAQTQEVDYTNEAGEAVKVSTKLLFDELYHHPNGRDCNAGKRINELYPALFELEDKVEAKRQEIQEYEITSFGFAGNHMRLIDFIHLIDSIVEFRLSPHKTPGAEEIALLVDEKMSNGGGGGGDNHTGPIEDAPLLENIT